MDKVTDTTQQTKTERNTNLSLPPTLQDADGPGHDVTGQKKTSCPKQEKLQVINWFVRLVKP